MRTTKIVRCLAFLLFLAKPLYAVPPNHYQVRLELRPQTHFLRASVVLELSSPVEGSVVTIILNKSLRVTKVDCGLCKGFRFATAEPAPYRYIAEGAPLYIDLKRPVKLGEPLKIGMDYEGQLTQLEWPVNVLGPEWSELALYSGWFPFVPDIRFRYDVQVKTDTAYTVTGAGAVTEKGKGLWSIQQPDETADMVVIACRGLNTLQASSGSVTVQYAPAVAAPVASEVLRVVDTSLRHYSSWFGPPQGSGLKVVLTPRTGGGGYSRPGLLSIPLLSATDIGKPSFIWSLAHEAGHLWWTGAPVTNWEDWLNESFAEYSAWLMIREILGEQRFEERIAIARKETTGKPAIWGIDRNSADAHVVLYDKGALLLHDLSKQMGEARFLALLAGFAQDKQRTTAEFLSLLRAATSQETCSRFERSLRE